MPPAKKAAESREILVILRDGQQRKVGNIPSNAKITYGPVAPGTRDFSGGGNALRIYTTTNNQLAVFVGVQEFRDLSLTVQHQKVSISSAEESEQGPKGSKSRREAETVIEWESV